MTRRFSSFGTQDLENRARSAPHDIPDIIDELGHRGSRQAQQLLSKLLALNGAPLPASPEQPEMFSDAPPTKRKRKRPNDWKTRFKFPPTPEQEAAVDLFLTGESMKISAFAGAGKTSTLKLLSATAPDERGLYLAFNKSIATEARSTFASRTDCRTTHSAALQDLRSKYAFTKDKWFNSLNARQLTAAWKIERYKAGPTALEPDMIAFLVLSTVRKFCQSSDDTLLPEHVQLVGRALGLPPTAKSALVEHIWSLSMRLWAEMISEKSDIPLGHDGYLKLWSLSKPVLAYDFILLDEAQDTNPAVLSVMRLQKCQTIYVGDKHQQIYEWRGAENAMETIATSHEAHLTMSFRFGPQLAKEAGRILTALGETHKLQGNPRIRTAVESVGQTKAVLTRTNAMLFREVIAALVENQKPHIVGGTKEMKSLLEDVDKLQAGHPGSHPDFFGFYNWREVEEFAQGPEGEHLLAFVNLVNQIGRSALWRAVLSAVDDEADADVIISTAHKAKGREWDSVRIADDFAFAQSETGRIPYSEARLFYVAITRAQKKLVVDPVLVSAFSSNLSPDNEIKSRPRSRAPRTVDTLQPAADQKMRANSTAVPTTTKAQRTAEISRPQQPRLKVVSSKPADPINDIAKPAQKTRRKRFLGIF